MSTLEKNKCCYHCAIKDKCKDAEVTIGCPSGNFTATETVKKEKIKEGKKYDNNKLRWDLLPIHVIEEIVKVFTYGSKKYDANNWKELEDPIERYYAALMRHLVQWRKGEKVDPESGLYHLAQVATNVIFLLWFELKKT